MEKRKKVYLLAGIAIFILFVGVGGRLISTDKDNTSAEKDIYIAFATEIYQEIKENYWDSIEDDKLANLFKLAAEKVSESPQNLANANQEGVEKMLAKIIANMDKAAKKKYVASLADVVLANLEPFGRSRLYTTQQEKDLKNTVQNIDKSTDLYGSLGLDKTATEQEIKKAYKDKTEELEDEEELASITRAFNALTNKETRKTYDNTGAEPTVLGKKINSNIAYIKITQMSPISFDEFRRVVAELDTGSADSLILDLRGNIGGAIDILPYFLGPFIGPDNYAYEFFKQGEREPFKTLIGWLPGLVRYKKVVVLIDEATQSSAELMAATIKKYNVGVLVGVPTRGWGTVERVFPLETQIDDTETYSMFLVHSITLRNDGQAIEGRGVDPAVYTTDPDWEDQLFSYFEYRGLVNATKKLIEE